MAQYARGNELTCTVSFVGLDGTKATNAELVVTYTNLSGAAGRDVIEMTVAVDGVTWSGVWDSSPAAECEATWCAKCWGGIKGSIQGYFSIVANPANLTT